jgi:aminoglycoside 3-N-acetyltransferase
MSVSELAASLIADLGDGPVFVHSDPLRAATLVPATRDRKAFLDSHVALLREISAGRSLVSPAFNYDFPRTHFFDVNGDPAQLGPVPEHFRSTAAEWRTHVPIFSVAGTGAVPGIPWGDRTDPFGPESIFAWLVAHDGVILYYGGTFHYNTIVHYAERLAGGPPYRYDKIFGGDVRTPSGSVEHGSLNYHVRPLNTGLDYDWPLLLQQARDAGVCRSLDAHPQILGASARDLTDLWVTAMQRDPLALLDSATRKWVEPKLDDLGRRFEIGDFEPQGAVVANTA